MHKVHRDARCETTTEMKKIGLIFLMLLVGLYSRAEYTLDYSAEFIGTAGSGNFAPHYMSSNVHGIVTQTNSSLLRLDIHRGLEKDKRVSFG